MRRSVGGVAVLALLAFALVASGCTQNGGEGAGSGEQKTPAPVEQPAPKEKPKAPEYTSWVVYINDDDSYSEGPITYKIALNLTATNPTPYINGTYEGNATASTSTNGTVSGKKGSGQLEANAIAQSGNLQFTIEDPAGALTQLDPDTWKYSGTGTITMKAAGTASVNGASGGFGNTSGQKIDVQVNGSKVTLSVDIQGHTYTFDGTISGKE